MIRDEHDPLCRWHGLPTTDSGAYIDYPFPCACGLIAKVRADEREQVDVSWQNDFDTEMTDLYAKVEALPGSPNSALDWVLRVDVLALFDGVDR